MTRPGGRGAALLKALKERQEAQTKPGKPDPEDSPPTKPVDSPDQFTDVSEYREKSDSLEVIAKLEKPQEEAATVKADLPENAKTEDSVNIESPQKVSEEPQITANEFVKKKGSKGRPIDLASNFIALEAKEGSGIYEYKVQFDPPQDMMRTMYECLNQLSDVIGTNKMFNGCLLILPVKLADSEFKTKALDEDVTVTLTLTASKGFSDPSCLRLYQVLLNRTFKALKLFSVKAGGAHAGQRSYFDPANKNVLVKHNIEIWPGYITNIDHFDGGVFLMFDSCNKVIRTETVADVLAMCFKKNPKGFPEVALKSLLGQSIMTRYNNRSYRIDDLNLDMSPESTFERIKGEPITFLEYYKVPAFFL
jgi:aubergine-like protein